jgi:hypothetical protein
VVDLNPECEQERTRAVEHRLLPRGFAKLVKNYLGHKAKSDISNNILFAP